MYDRVNIKAVIIVTSLAAVISVAAGGIGGVAVGTLLVRAVVFAVLFALGTVLVNIVVDTFLPELKSSDAGPVEEESEEAGERGQNVNIVMDDGAEGDAGSPGAAPVAEGDAEVPMREVSPEIQEFQAAGAEELTSANKGTELPDIGVFSSLADDEEDSTADEEEVLASDATEAPHMGAMQSRFSSMQTKDEEKIDFFQNNTTAEEMAKGVRTMLKSDEKKG